MANHFPDSSSEHRLGSGNFFGAVRGRVIHSGAIFTDLRHAIPRQLPNHSHELPFFGLLLDGQYGERYGRQHKQFRPFSIMFRPAGVPHQDEIGPAGLRFFHFELRAGWKNRIAECSGNLDLAYEDTRGGRLIWLALKLMRETIGAPSRTLFALRACWQKPSLWRLGFLSKKSCIRPSGYRGCWTNCTLNTVASSLSTN